MISLKDLSIKCRNFKCFSDTAEGFDEIKPVNVIIGRNNSGKTTLLDLIDHATEQTDINGRGHKGKTPQTLVSWKLTDEFLVENVPKNESSLRLGNYEWWFTPQEWARRRLTDKHITGTLSGESMITFLQVKDFDTKDEKEKQQLNWVANKLGKSSENPFKPFAFRRIVADRDIGPEKSDSTLEIQSNGEGLTNVIQRYMNADWLDRDLIEKNLLKELNAIFYPDANYLRILVEQKGTGEWEIHVEESGKGRIPMSQTGSGLKTVLLVLANLLLVPMIGEKPRPISEFLFGFEELENNLHPAIQRRLFRYLRQRAIEDECHFFITTHSNVVIDLFSDDEHAQILHVKHNGELSTVAKVQTSAHGHSVLDDLDIRASDLLQTNVVVWVEGPSDRAYFTRWVELWSDGELIEGVHYQCLPFGGSINAHLSFEPSEWVDEMIPALKINRHAIVLADSDRRAVDDDLKAHTKRLADEVEKVGGHAWITMGREVENYIPVSVFQQLFKIDSLRGPGRFADVFDYVAKHKKNKTKPRKVKLAHEITPLLTRDSLAGTPDLSERLTEVCELIRKWNNIECR